MNKRKENIGSFSGFLRDLLTDPNLYLLFDRAQAPTLRSRVKFIISGNTRIQSILQFQDECMKTADYWRNFHNERKTEDLRFASAPHSWRHYIQGRVAEYLGIKCFFELESRVNGYVFIGKNLGRSPNLVAVPENLEAPGYRADAKQYISKCESNYQDAIPEYEKRRLERNKGRYFSLGDHTKKHWSRPSNVLNALRCWRELGKVSKNFEKFHKKKYIVFFPHYQPERTSVPEGYGFSQQKLAILALREALPSDVHLLVKEHPSTFTNQCVKNARWPSWYQSIAYMEGVDFVDIQTDNFKLIDGAVATSTLSGTVAHESLLRGVPTIVFGVLKWLDTFGQHHYHEHSALKSFLSNVANGSYNSVVVRSSTVETMLEKESRYVIDKRRSDFNEIKQKVICAEMKNQ